MSVLSVSSDQDYHLQLTFNHRLLLIVYGVELSVILMYSERLMI